MSTLGESGQILVTQAAARQYADACGLGVEEARRELTALMMGARRDSVEPASGAEGWRARSRSLDVDVSALVTREGALAVVTHVSVRASVRRGGLGARGRRRERRREGKR